MATLDDVRRISLSLPGTMADEGGAVLNKGKYKGFAWLWKERIDPKKPRVPNPDVLAIRTANLDEKEYLLAADPDIFFTEPHYNGYPAVLVRLANIEADELEELLIDAWRTCAPPALVRQYDSEIDGE